MTRRAEDAATSDHRTSRRHFFKLLAGSPLLALAHPGLPPAWRQGVDRELRHSAAAPTQPAAMLCPDCGQEMLVASHAPS